MTTTLYIICGILLLWLIGVDVRYYHVNKKISIIHNTQKTLLDFVNGVIKERQNEKEKKEKEENKSEPQRNNKKRIIKKVKRVRAPKVSS